MSNSDLIQLAGLGLLILCEQYAAAPWQFPVFAKIWDFLARILSAISWATGFAAMHARNNYYAVVSHGS